MKFIGRSLYCGDSYVLFLSGNIIYLNVLGNKLIVLNSIDDARELLDKRGAQYSNRPRAVFAADMSVTLFSYHIARANIDTFL